MRVTAVAKFLSGLALLFVASVAAATLISTFDSSAEGWTAASNVTPGPGVAGFGWHSTGGNPGGNIRAEDPASTGVGGGWWFVAPAGWLGDWTLYVGGKLSFDVFASAGTSATLNSPAPPAVVLGVSDGGSIRAVASAGAMVDQWVSVRIGLVASSFTFTPGTTYTTFETALANIDSFVIPADFVFQQTDVTRLDNVRLMAAPEPGTGLLMIVACAALAGLRRGKKRRPIESSHRKALPAARGGARLPAN